MMDARGRDQGPPASAPTRGMQARPCFITGQISESEATAEKWLKALSRPGLSFPPSPPPSLCGPREGELAGLANRVP